MFNPSSHLFYVDFMGNVLSNMKLAFYESPDDKNFISKMLQESAESDARDHLVQAYEILREIYNDMLTPIRQRQARGFPDLDNEDIMYANHIGQLISQNRYLEEIKCTFTNFALLNAETSSDKNQFYDHHYWQVADILCFRMTESDYRAALTGLPADIKTNGTPSQLILKDKIELLKA